MLTNSRCIAYGVSFMNGALGLEAWRWLFIIEGVPSGRSHVSNAISFRAEPSTVIVGLCVMVFLPSYPQDASWLTAEEQRIQEQRLDIQKHQRYCNWLLTAHASPDNFPGNSISTGKMLKQLCSTSDYTGITSHTQALAVVSRLCRCSHQPSFKVLAIMAYRHNFIQYRHMP